MLKKFIERPVMATVISCILVILGVIGMVTLPLERFPDIAPPAVRVTAYYPGANAETILRSVAPSLEEAINGVDDMTYMKSVSSNDGSLVITIYFTKGTDPEQAAVNVQNRVSQATSQLPPEVVQRGIVTTKQSNSLLLVHALYSEAPDKYDQNFLANYANINIIPDLKRIQGVGQASLLGGNKEYSMRIWLKPAQMAAYKMSAAEILNAINDQNLEAAPGKFGEGSNEAFEYVIKYDGKENRPGQYEDMIIRANPDGSFLRLRDIARVEFGSYTYNSSNTYKGMPAASLVIFQLPGSDANAIQVKAAELLAKARLKYPKGIKDQTTYNTKIALDTSIEQVKHTLVEAFVLVFIVVFLFLQDFRSTLIPAIAVPVAIIGTFFFMNVFGFTINLLTLFALVLAIGIVVDDAIVVVEAVHSKMERERLGPSAATLEAMHEISGAIISITLVMSAVFLPIGLIKGSTGLFYRQFAFTLAIAIVISAVNALTLSPALCALILREPHHPDAEGADGESGAGRPVAGGFKKRFFRAFNAGFDLMKARYGSSLEFLIRRKWIAVGALLLVTAITAISIRKTKTGFVPTEDIGFLAVAVHIQAGASLERMNQYSVETEKTLKLLPQVAGVNSLSGYDFLTFSNSPSSLQLFILLKPVDQRGPEKSIPEIISAVRKKMAGIKGVDAFVFEFPSIPGYSNVDGLDVVLQDRTEEADLRKFSDVSDKYIASLLKRKEIGTAFTTFKSNFPQFNLEIDKDKAKQLGVGIRDVLLTMQTYFGSIQASDFNRFSKYYRVVAQADVPDRTDPTKLDGIYVKNNKGDMLPISTLVRLKRVYGPETATRYNLFNSISLTVLPKKGYSTGDAIKVVQEVSASELPEGYNQEFSGITLEQISAGNQAVIIFALCLVFVYFLLAAQYESYILPFAVVLSIPTGIFGVFMAIGIAGIENNIYVQVALIMLIGLLSKNAILIVEFAVQRRRAGHPLVQSAIEGATLRLRPIIMTSFAFIVGLLPMMNAQGPSANGNHSISIAAVGGMLSGVALGLSLIPVLFVIFQRLQEKISRHKIVELPATGLRLIPIVLVVVAVSGFASCKPGKDVATADLNMPSTYRNAAPDTSSIATMPWQSFFADTALKSLIRDALRYNNDLQAAVKNIGASELTLKQARLGNVPSVGLGASVSDARPSDNSFDIRGVSAAIQQTHLEDYTVAASLSWEADIWGKIRNQKAAALAAYLATDEARKALQTRIINDLSKGYYNLLLLDAQLAIAQRNIILADSTLDLVKLQYSSGVGTSLAVQQALAQKLTAAALVPRLQQETALQETAISILCGRYSTAVSRDIQLDSITLPESLGVGIPTGILSRRPEVKQAEFELSRANAEVGFTRAAMYPSLTIGAEGGLNAFKASNWFNIPASLFGVVAGGVAQPLFDKKRLSTQWNIAKVNREKSVLAFRQSVLTAYGEVSDALTELDKLKDQQGLVAGRTDALVAATQNSRELYRNGKATYLDVIVAENSLLESELELAAVKKSRLDASVDLYRSLGGGWQ